MGCEIIKSIVDSKDKVIIDVRSDAEFISNHIKGAYTIPLNSLEDNAHKLVGKDVYLYCQSGSRSEMARRLLATKGINSTNLGSINKFIGCLRY